MDDQSNVVAIRSNREQEARAAFGNYVQSVAFNLTLSRQMIWGMQILRNRDREAMLEHGRAVPLLRSLERRGLVWHDYIPPSSAPAGHQYHKLTKAGELVCDVLVEAGLMPPKEKRRPAKRA